MIKKLISYVAEFKRDSILTPVFVALEAVMETIIPLLMAWIIDDGVGKANMKYVCAMGAVMIAVSFISLACGALSGKYAASASTGFL